MRENREGTQRGGDQGMGMSWGSNGEIELTISKLTLRGSATISREKLVDELRKQIAFQLAKRTAFFGADSRTETSIARQSTGAPEGKNRHSLEASIAQSIVDVVVVKALNADVIESNRTYGNDRSQVLGDENAGARLGPLDSAD